MTTDTAEIPQFKLAKVGKDRPKKDEKKKGGIPLWLRMAGNNPLGGLGTLGAGTGGSGFLGLSGLVAKGLIALLIGALCVSAYNVGKGLGPGDASLSAPKMFMPKEREAHSATAGGGASGSSGLSMVSGSLDGKTAEERAAEAAAANAEAGKSGTAEPPEAAPAAPTAGDMMAQVQEAAGSAPEAAKEKGPFSQRFGQLTSSLGGARSSLSGGSGLAGGVNSKFDPTKLGTSKRFSAPPKASRSSSKPARANTRGRAFRQLRAASDLSRAGSRASTAEAAATAADTPFNNNPAIGTVITGGGAGVSNAGGGGVTDSGPVGNTGSTATSEPEEATKKNSTPWKQQAQMGAMALMGASILLLIARFLPPPWSMIARAIAAALGAMAIAMGQQAMQMGGGVQGKLLMAGGAAAMIGAATSAMVEGAVGMWAGIAGGLLSGAAGVMSMMKKDQQKWN